MLMPGLLIFVPSVPVKKALADAAIKASIGFVFLN
jgi:hypothetical protein